MLYTMLVGLHILVSIILILVVLLQTGKSADLAGAFGGGGSQTAFGSRGAATFLSKMTTTAAVLFMVTSFTLAIYSAKGGSSVLDVTDIPGQTGAPPPAAAPFAAPPSTDDDTGATTTDDQSGGTAGTDDGLAPAESDGVNDDAAGIGNTAAPETAADSNTN